MKIAEFFRAVLPEEGWHYVATPIVIHDKPRYSHTASTDLSELALLARGLINQNKDTFFALGSFRESSYVGTDGRKHRRTHENVEKLKALWQDVDCGEGKQYPTQKEAFVALLDVCQQYDIPRPSYVVSSGNGLHLYWALSEDVHKQVWKQTAVAFASVLQWAGFRVDPSRSADMASVLRVPTSQNYKDRDQPKPVRLLEQASSQKTIELAELRARLAELIRDNQIAVKPVRTRSGADNSDLAGKPNFLPCNPRKMADRCAVFRAMRDTLGVDQTEPQWKQCLNVLSCESVIDGRAVAHEWSSQHPGYSEDACNEKFDLAVEIGPTRCETFRQDAGGLCDGCEESVTSPIALGYEVHHVTAVAGNPIPDMLPGMESYAYDPKRGLFRNDTDRGPVYICSAFPRITEIYKDQDGKHWARIETLLPRGTVEEADIEVKDIGSGHNTLASALGARAGLVVRDSGEFTTFMKTWYDNVRQSRDLSALYKQFGWQKQGGFLLGKELYRRNDAGEVEVIQASISRELASNVDVFDPVGELAENVRLINELYNRPHREVHQFALLASLGSILISLAHKGPVGIPLSLWHPISGGGKTTVCKFAVAFWGDPDGAGQAVYSKNTTDLAMYTMAGARRHLPLLVDETTRWEPAKIAEFLYAYSTGLAKAQAKAEGGLRDNTTRNWQNILYTTANKSMVSHMANTIRNAGPMIVRVFELMMTNEQLESPEARPIIRALEKHHGLIGREFLKFVVKHQEQVVAKLETLIEDFQRLDNRTDARYWCLTAASTILAGFIARKLGLVAFDIAHLKHFAEVQMRHMRANITEATEDPESHATRLVAEMLPRVLVTNHDKKPCVIDPGFPAPRHRDIVGRYLTETSTLYLSIQAIRAWCGETGDDYNQLRKVFGDMGWLARGGVQYRITKGTHLHNVGNQRCWEIQFPEDTTMQSVVGGSNVSNLDDFR